MRLIVLFSTLLFLLCSGGCCHQNVNSCSIDISGDWNYTSDYEYLRSGTITFSQTDCMFKGVNPDHTFYGIIIGNEVRLTVLVTGETMEGIVMRVEGSYFEGPVDQQRRITGLYTRPNGENGSWMASDRSR